MDVRVDRYKPSEVDGVAAFIRAEDIDSKIANEIERGVERYTLLIAWNGSEVVGVLEGDLNNWFADPAFPVSGWQAWICNMAVGDSARRNGVGARLVRAFADTCDVAGKDYIGLMVNPVGDAAGRVAFFERCGFSVVPAQDDLLLMGARTAAVQARCPRGMSV